MGDRYIHVTLAAPPRLSFTLARSRPSLARDAGEESTQETTKQDLLANLAGEVSDVGAIAAFAGPC